MSGSEFANLITEHLKAQNVKFGVRKANSEKQKEYEVATSIIHGISLDLVNFALIESADGQVKIHTPLEDCLRRDITINSLYYNIKDRIVEDFTEQGLIDLKNKIIRTPVEPFEHLK